MNKPDPPAAPTGLEQPRGTTGATHKRAILGKILGWGFVACAVLLGALAARNMLLHPRSEHGRVAANAIGIAPRVSGPIKSLLLEDDQAVNKGDVLFEIDPEPHELAARVARANRDTVAGEIVNIERAIAAQKSGGARGPSGACTSGGRARPGGGFSGPH